MLFFVWAGTDITDVFLVFSIYSTGPFNSFETHNNAIITLLFIS